MNLKRAGFKEYFKGKEYGYAFEVDKWREFKIYQSIKKYNLLAAPQGFVYID